MTSPSTDVFPDQYPPQMGPGLRRDGETDQAACRFFSEMRWWRLRMIIPVSLSS
jgi:hypothetical protein